jgi:two-component system, sensor histidine kinase RpfC
VLAAPKQLLGRLGMPRPGTPEAAARFAVVTATALAAAGALPPLGFAALAVAATRSTPALPPYAAVALAATAGAAPAAAGATVALYGFAPVWARFADAREPPQLIGRILVATAVIASLFGLAAALPQGAGVAAGLLVATAALVFAWLLLLHAILRPAPSRWRRRVAGAGDAALVSGLLHVGGALTAAWVPLYFCAVFDSGLRFGNGALAMTALFSLAGFSAMAVATPFWAQQPLLVAGLAAGLTVSALYLARLARGVAEARVECAAAAGRLLALIGRELRPPAESVRRIGAELAAVEAAEGQGLAAGLERSATALLRQCEDIVELADIERTGAAPMTVPFDLHEIVGGAVAALRGAAAARGVEIGLRLDPRVPYRLRGCPRLLRRVVAGLTAAAIDRAAAGRVEASLDEVGRDGDAVRLRFAARIRDIAGETGGFDHVGLAVAERLAALLGGRVERIAAPGGGIVLAAEIGCALDDAPASAGLDLGHRPVLIATEDAQFAGELGTALVAWQADARWIGALSEAESHLLALGPDAGRAVLIVDGREEVLRILSRAHRLATAQDALVLLVAEAAWVDSLAGFADGEIAGILAAPVTPEVLGSALHALPFAAAPAAPMPAAAAPMPAAADRPLRILVADDNAANRKIVERILGAAGHQVDLADSGDEVLAMLEAHKADLVLIDLNLPGGDAYAAAKRCRLSYPGIPILALSADYGAEVERRCAEAGIDAVLTKPIEPSRLTTAVDAALGCEAGPPRAAEPAAVVRLISSHPRSPAVNPATVDERAVAALRSLGRGSDFFREVIEAFRADARQMLEQIRSAAAAADASGFAAAVDALRRCAANVGAVRLCEVLGALRETGAGELRRDGAAHLHRLGAELATLEAVLREHLNDGEMAGR